MKKLASSVLTLSIIGSLFATFMAGNFAAASAGTVPISSPANSTPSANGNPPANILPNVMRVRDAVKKLDAKTLAKAKLDSLHLPSAVAKDPSAWVDRSGKIFYVEEALPAIDPSASTATPADVMAGNSSVVDIPLDQAFELESRPGSNRTIYLDFLGATVENTGWNVSYLTPKIIAAPYDEDGDSSSFSDNERTSIIQAWQAVAEDYAPFDVNVTTKDLGADAIERTDQADLAYGTTALITSTADVVQTACGCGGIAYVDTFDVIPGHGYYQPAFVFNSGLPKFIAETVSHEVGHNLGLHHDGNSITGETYDTGHGSWAPIMGAGFYQPITHWSMGEYPGANNVAESDLQIIGGQLNPIADDVGDTVAESTVLSAGSSSISGLIGTRADVDLFKFTTTGGPFFANVAVSELAPNLVAKLELLDENLNSLAVTSNEMVSAHDLTDFAAAIDPLTGQLTAGTYYLSVDGIGIGNLTTGFSDYDSLGRYKLSVSIPDGSTSTISGFNLTGAYEGDTVTIQGQNLSDASSVSISGIEADFTQISDTEISYTVPTGASTDFVQVVTPLNTASSALKFTVFVGDLSSVGIGLDTTESALFVDASLRTQFTSKPAIRGLNCQYRWKADGVVLDREYLYKHVVTTSDLGKVLSVAVTCLAPDREPFQTTLTANAKASAGYLGYQGTASISGTAKVGETLTLSTGTYTPTPDSIAVKWYTSNNVLLQDSTSTTLVVPNSAAGWQIYVSFIAAKTNYKDSYRGVPSYTAQVTGGTLSSATVSLSGEAAVGSTLTCNFTNPNESSSVTIKWFRDSTTQLDSGSSTYSLTDSDVGHNVSCRLEINKSGFNKFTVDSSQSSTVTGAPLKTITGLVAHVSSFARVGQQMQGWYSSDSLAFDSITYGWYRGSTLIGSSAFYTPTNTDAGNELTFKVSATKAGYTPLQVTAKTAVIDGGTFTDGTLTISGTTRIGSTLTATASGFSPTPSSLIYTWWAGQTQLANSSSNKLVIPDSALGQKIQVFVTVSKSSFSNNSALAETASPVIGGKLKFASPSLSGDAVLGQELKLALDPTQLVGSQAVNIIWKRGATVIANNQQLSYVLGLDDVGKVISVLVTYADAYCDDLEFTRSSQVVAKANFPEFDVAVNGNPTMGQTLKLAVTGVTLASDATMAWLRDNTEISGATAETYTLGANDVGHKISAKVTLTSDGYKTGSQTSARTQKVAAAKIVYSKGAILGTTKVGKKLTLKLTGLLPARAKITYQWLRNSAAIKGAKSSSYKLIRADKGKVISLRIAVSMPGYENLEVAFKAQRKIT